ncbi:DUF2254 domain-containing protein [Methylocapsa polymorpha]|uniref:DUF2254 domain-containing protein n=1 Tax=Methylocapsa polymorpha TaxID=3080828 RepID=A0ABZ0HPQ9_9HYPH|nr:DUF2254 domain-containing protein [Methylocapsa sp. RX1]
MAKSLPVLFRSALYAFRGGFLIRPFVIALTLGAAGAILSSLEEQTPEISAFVPDVLFPSHADPQVAQAILTDIATSVMTVVSIVFAILLMTLTLASTQFSPRILVSFVRDRVTQWTLGVFLGTFSYCIAALPAARSLPYAFVPVATVTGAMILAPVCVGWLIYFIHHISNAISVNHIVDRIRRETELVIDASMPDQRRPSQLAEAFGVFPEKLEFVIASRQSGYIRFVDIDRLRSLAKSYRICLRLERRVGHFVPEGVALMRVSRGDRIAEERTLQLLAAIDIGPTRTMQQDVEFGIVQIVDIALRAISPAINDPTTAISCVDQLSCILIRWIGRAPPRSHFYDPPHVLRVVVPWINFSGLLDLAFEQIRHYSVADAAVSLRLMRALGDIASTVDEPAIRLCLLERGKRLIAGCVERLQEDDLERLRQRLSMLESGTALED